MDKFIMILMQRTGLMKGVLISLTVLIAGCSSKVAQTNEFSGFLGDYSELRPVQTESGHETLRWISPDFRENSYKSVYIDPVIYYPRAVPTERVSATALEQIRLYTENQMKRAISQRVQLSQRPEKGGLEVKTAITSVNARNKDMQFYEVVPVAAVIGGAMAVTGYRAQNTELFLEVRVSDVSTGKDMIKVVRKSYGQTVPNNKAPVTADDIKEAIDAMVKDVTGFPRNE